MFNNLKTDGIEEAQDRLGGFAVFNTDVYPGKVKVAYGIKSEGGALGVALTILLDGGREYAETVYVSNKKGENFYVKDGKKYPMPGFTNIDDLCLITTGIPLAEQATEEKVVKIYDYDQKKELPKSVPVLVGLTDQPVLVAIQKSLEDKTKKNDAGDYVPTGETREANSIEKFFHPEYKLTVNEAKAGVEEPKFLKAWTEKNKDQVRDKTTASKGGNSGQAGAPGKSSGNGAPLGSNSGQAAAPKKSLFGNKS